MRIKDSILSWRWWLGLKSVAVQGEPPQIGLTVVIPAYNEERCIEATIRSLLLQTYPITEIIVVDHCSSDNTGDIARSLGVTVVRPESTNHTKTQAQNFGLGWVTTPLFVNIDADTSLAPNAVYEAMRYFNDPSTSVVCGFVLPSKVKTLWERGRFAEYLFGFGVIKSAQNHIGAIFVSSGCFSIFRTGDVLAVGGFNQRTMAEDMDFTWDLAGRGGRICYASRAVCFAVEPETWKIYAHQVNRWQAGFLQNIKVRRFKLTGIGWRLACLVYVYLVWNIVGIFGETVALLLFPYVFFHQSNLAVGLLFLGVVQIVTVWIPILVKGFELRMTWKAAASIPAYYVTQYANAFLFMRAIWNEWICNKNLKVWVKGHT
jgi:biofilm PGA synthesis N-glycosyltransferase PgaC